MARSWVEALHEKVQPANGAVWACLLRYMLGDAQEQRQADWRRFSLMADYSSGKTGSRACVALGSNMLIPVAPIYPAFLESL